MRGAVQAFNLLLYSAFAIPASIVDLRTKRIPDWLTLPGAFALCASDALFAFALGESTQSSSFLAALSAAVLCSGFFLSLRVFTKGLGLGDVKFVAMTGLLCGPAGSALALTLASTSALAFWAIIAARGKADSSTRIPFAPFIAFGTTGSAIISLKLTTS